MKPMAASEAGSAGLAGWTVYIDVSNSDQFSATDPNTTTDASGNFQFNSLAAGAYTIRVVSQLGWRPTLPPVISGNRSLSPRLKW